MLKLTKFILLLAFSQNLWAACDQTLNVGDDLLSAVSSSANGTTICLNSGDYGWVDLPNITRTGFVNITSTVGKEAVLSVYVSNSDYIRFNNMSLTGSLIQNGSTNIQIVNSLFIPNQTGLAVVDSSNILVDNVDFTNVNQATWSGRLSLNNASYSTVTNSKFIGVGNSANTSEAAADGIMIIGNANNNTIGPNNIFSGILQGLCDVANPGSHCDSIQYYGGGANNLITGNHFVNGDTFMMFPDGCQSTTVYDNVFDGSSTAYEYKLQFGSCSNLVFNHNTLRNVGVAVDSKDGNPASTNAQIINNVQWPDGGVGSIKTTGGNGCTGCVIDYNLRPFPVIGVNDINGLPTFVNGQSPAVVPDFALSSTSLGHLLASDGIDIGAIIALPDPPIVQATGLSLVSDTLTAQQMDAQIGTIPGTVANDVFSSAVNSFARADLDNKYFSRGSNWAFTKAIMAQIQSDINLATTETDLYNAVFNYRTGYTWFAQ